MKYRYSAPSDEGEYPLVICLSRANDAELFPRTNGARIVEAPQANGTWTADDILKLTESISDVNADKIYLAGHGDGADAALSIAAANPQKFAAVVAAEPTTPLTDEQISSLSGANTAVYIFAQYGNETARINANKLQSSKMTDAMYTEYPYEENDIALRAATTPGLYDQLISHSLTGNAAKKTATRVVDLAIFMGQSNMAGRGEYAEAAECNVGHGFEYHPVTEPGVLTTVLSPFGKYENNDAVNDSSGSIADRRSGDMVPAFMESYYQVSGVPLIGVQCSRGGTDSTWWNNSVRMTEAAARYNKAKAYLEANGYTIGKQFMVWCQGCTDADKNRSIEAYKSNTKAVYEAMKAGTGLTDMFIIRIGHENGDRELDARYKAINLAQKELADETDGITAVASFYTDECYAQMRDAYHYHQPAYNSVGTIAGNNTAYTLYTAGVWISSPEPCDTAK